KEKPKEIARFVNEFKKLEPFGYKIIEWNEDNYDIKSEPFIIKAYNEKKWAHVSDFVRLDVLYKYGGIYLDTDVEIVKVFDDLLSFDLFVGFMWPCNLGTAVIGASKGNDVIRDLLIGYRKNEVSLNSPNNDSFTRYFINKEFGFKLNGKEQLLRKNI
ncbi:glycosyltransferase family 32 protein, partial [Klebsiella pneumoniae]